jgi:nucleoside-diphosphate-sugar epimerase
VDFSRAIIMVLQAERSKVAYNIFNVGDTRENYTKSMIIKELLRHFPHAKIKRVEKKEDPRDYRVKFEKIQTQLGFRISRIVPDGIDEIKKVIQCGIIPNPEEPRYYNVPYQP